MKQPCRQLSFPCLSDRPLNTIPAKRREPGSWLGRAGSPGAWPAIVPACSAENRERAPACAQRSPPVPPAAAGERGPGSPALAEPSPGKVPKRKGALAGAEDGGGTGLVVAG